MEGLLMYYCCCCGNYCMILGIFVLVNPFYRESSISNRSAARESASEKVWPDSCFGCTFITDSPLMPSWRRIVTLTSSKRARPLWSRGTAPFALLYSHRDDRNEIHYLLVCTNCHVPIAYKVSKKEESSKYVPLSSMNAPRYLYILNDSVCDDPSVLNNQIVDEDHLVPSCIQVCCSSLCDG